MSRNGVVPLRAGVTPPERSMTSVGPMARTAVDCAAILDAIGVDRRTAPAPDGLEWSGRRIGVPRAWLDLHSEQISDEVATAFDDAVELVRSLGAQIEDIRDDAVTHARHVCSLISVAEAFSRYADDLRSRPEAFGDPVRKNVLAGGLIESSDYIAALRAREILSRRLLDATAPFDALLLPTVATPAPRWDPETKPGSSPSFTAVFNPARHAGGLGSLRTVVVRTATRPADRRTPRRRLSRTGTRRGL